MSSFVDTLLQPIAQKQQSFIKDTTDFISFIEKTKISKDTILVSMDVSSLYTNIPEEEGTEIVCKAYDSFHNYNPPIPTRFLREMLGLILNENSFQFNGENYLQTHGTAMGTKMAVSFANIFMAKIETSLRYNKAKPSQKNGDDILTISPPSGTVIEKTSINLLNKLTNSTLPSNSRPKYQRTRLPSSTQWCSKEKD